MNNAKTRKRSRRPSRGLLLGLTALTVLLLIAAVLAIYVSLTQEPAVPTVSETTAASIPETTAEPTGTEPETAVPATEPPVPVTAANGIADSVLCKASYTVSMDDAADAANKIIATFGPQRLTNAELQVLYLAEISSYRDAGLEPMPDFAQPLDCQICPLGDGTSSWQHYFLNRAINSWHAQQALIRASQKPQPITEEAFQPNIYQDLHTPNITPDLPVNDFLYADQPYYKPNSMNHAYLDGLGAKLDTLAKELGYAGLEDYTRQVYGSAVTPSDLTNAAQNLNLAYMYFTERSFYIEPSEEDLAAAQLPENEEKTVDLRHILLIPEDAAVAADGTVTAEEEQWTKCERTAQQLVQTWLADFQTKMIPDGKNVHFSRVAYQNSQDAGSKGNGGLYTGVRQGQLMDVLDEWCFDPERKANDYAVIRSDLGIHIVFLTGFRSPAEEAVRDALILRQEQKQWKHDLSAARLMPHFDAVALWADCTKALIPQDEVLYPDVAHERYPEAMVFLQQDYATTSYGSSTVGRGGCGITTMAMLSTYLTDDLHTPAMLAKNYANYHDESGTRAEMFLYVPAELGFQLEGRSSSVDEAIEALQANKRVVSLQWGGHFTGAGHYLLLQKYYADNDTFQVRDSNIANYGKLSGHKVDYFTRANIVSGGTSFYIFPEKVVRTPACTRCGSECAEQAPELLLSGEYLCPKCTTALSRRNNFQNILAEFIAG